MFRLDENFDITAAIGWFKVHGHYTRSALYQECNNYMCRAIYIQRAISVLVLDISNLLRVSNSFFL